MKTAAQKYSESNAEAILAYFRGVDGGILNSNPSEFPNDRSEKSKERAAAFAFAKAAALRMKLPKGEAKQ